MTEVRPRCEDCIFWKKDYGMWCVNGWTKMYDDDGHCHLFPEVVPKKKDDFCGCFEKKENG